MTHAKKIEQEPKKFLALDGHELQFISKDTIIETQTEIRSKQVGIKLVTSLSEHFYSLPDPRRVESIEHKLIDIITIAICAVICGADDWVAVVEFGHAKRTWLSSFLELINGIPSHDTFNRVFNRLSAKKLQECFASWIQSLVTISDGEIIAIDGKKLRRSYDKKSGKAAIHMISAWASRNRLVLGQIKTDEESNEITAIPKLLKLLDIKNATLTIDAAGCQKNIAKDIIQRQADYVLALKGNQGTLYKDVKDYFEYALTLNFKDIPYQYHETIDKGHGRIEKRRYWTIDNINWLDDKEKWAGLTSIGMVEAHRTVGEKTSQERRFYISSKKSDAKGFAQAVRTHWSIENTLHWSLDVTFGEDFCRLRKKNGAENFAILRRIVCSILQQETSAKIGIANKRFKAALNENYFFKVLAQE